MTARYAAVAAAFALLLSGAAVATAAPKPVPKACLQLTDDVGDGAPLGTPSHDVLDIVSGDIATGRKNLVAALRLKSVAADPMLVGGTTHSFSFNAGGVYTLYYRIFAGGETEAMMAAAGSTSETTVAAVVDRNTATITWTVPRKSIAALKKAGIKISGLSAASYVANNIKGPSGTMRGSFGADTAQSAKTYTDGAPTCLRGV